MKRSQIATAFVAVAAFFVPFTSSAVPLTLDFDIYGVGSFAPASQANNDVQVTTAANALVTWYNGGSNPNPGTPTFTLASTNLGLLPTSLTFGFKDELAPFVAIGNEYSYALGKYGNEAYLFYIGNLDVQDGFILPSRLGGNGLSHLVAFSATSTPRSVPDGGATLMLLGLSMTGIGYARRKFLN